MFESLESRQLLSVTAHVDDGKLILRGEGSDDEIVISRGDDLTTLNVLIISDGGSFIEPRPFTGVTRGIRIDLGAGNDRVLLNGVRIRGSVNIDAGDGNDELIVRSSRISGRLTWQGGDGDDSILVRKSTIQHNLFLDGQSGRDRTYLSFVHVRNNLVILDADGPSIVTFTRVSVDRDAVIGTGASTDSLTIHDSTFKSSTTIATNRGDDRIRIRGTVFRQTPIVDAGPGDNHIDREVILSWDFNRGEQGWKAGFADYPAGQIIGTKADGSPLIAEEAYQLGSGIEPLPHELGVQGTGFKLTGNNLSDDLFMYLTKQLGATEGIVAGTEYKISYIISYATDLTAESRFNPRYLKVGGLSQSPQIAPGPNDTFPPVNYRLNADIGNQANSGANASVAGFMHNDLDVPNKTWGATRREHTHPNAISANAAGQIWLLAGVDSAFESLATIYVQTITATLTPLGSTNT